MDTNEFFELPNEEILKEIRIRKNEDSNLVENQIELFRAWLRNERHLPKDVDSNLLRNFIRYCQCDLEAAKTKFQRYMVNRAKLKNLVPKYELNEEYFKNWVHRCLVPSRYPTPAGLRIGFVGLPADVLDFDIEKLTHYLLTFLDILGTFDCCDGYMGIFDFQNVTTEFLGKLNVKLLIEALDLIFNMSPFHMKAIHFINLPKIPETIFSMVKRLIKGDIVEK
ncbi:CRAL-TRIO domain containing protein, partial [Oryctes borbonicus]